MTEGAYTVAAVAELLCWPASRIYGYVRDGLIEPLQRRPMHFAFADLVVLRTIDELLLQGIPARRVRGALRQLRARLPDGRPLSALRLRAAGARVLVRDGELWFEATSGQGELPLEDRPPSAVTELQRARDPECSASDALYDEALTLEDEDPAAAMALYRRAITANDAAADAHINLGRLLQASGERAEAEACYRAALARDGGHALAWFNLGTVQEEGGALDQAIASYLRATEASGDTLPDAHYNLARLYEQRGDRARAIVHLRALKLLCH